MVLSYDMTQVIVRVHALHPMNVEQRQVAADPQTKQSTWAVSPPIVFIHQCHLLLLSPKADTCN